GLASKGRSIGALTQPPCGATPYLTRNTTFGTARDGKRELIAQQTEAKVPRLLTNAWSGSWSSKRGFATSRERSLLAAAEPGIATTRTTSMSRMAFMPERIVGPPGFEPGTNGL